MPLQTDTNHDGWLFQIAVSSGNTAVSRVLEVLVQFWFQAPVLRVPQINSANTGNL
jgi:hypothetical protein